MALVAEKVKPGSTFFFFLFSFLASQLPWLKILKDPFIDFFSSQNTVLDMNYKGIW